MLYVFLQGGVEAKTSPIIDINELRIGKLLGEGGFGTVYEAKWKKKVVAAKVYRGNLLKNLSREIQILTSLPPHPHMLTFFGAALSSDAINTYIITELASNGSLYDYLHERKEVPSSDQRVWEPQWAVGTLLCSHLVTTDGQTTQQKVATRTFRGVISMQDSPCCSLHDLPDQEVIGSVVFLSRPNS